MLSYYDTLSYSVRKKSLFAALCVSLLMLLFFALLCFSLEKQFAVFSNLKSLLFSNDKVVVSISFDNMVKILKDILFRVVLSKKMAALSFLFVLFNFILFSFQVVTARKDLFKQTSHSSNAFYFIAFGELLLLLLPLLYGSYVFFLKMLPLGVNYFIENILFGKAYEFKFPYSIKESVIWGVGLFFWTVYSISLFACHFSFKSLFNLKMFLLHIKVVFELISQILILVIFMAAIFVGIGYCYWVLDPIYVCFFGLLIYFIFTVSSSVRWVLMAFFLLLICGGVGLGYFLGCYSFRGYTVTYLLWALSYFSFFFIVCGFFSALAYSFVSTAYVFCFNQTPATDVKEKAPEKLRRIDELYKGYLKNQGNDLQDNFFHHMEK